MYFPQSTVGWWGIDFISGTAFHYPLEALQGDARSEGRRFVAELDLAMHEFVRQRILCPWRRFMFWDAEVCPWVWVGVGTALALALHKNQTSFLHQAHIDLIVCGPSDIAEIWRPPPTTLLLKRPDRRPPLGVVGGTGAGLPPGVPRQDLGMENY